MTPPLPPHPPQALSSGVFELKIDSFASSRGICRSSSQSCQIFFRVCLKHSQDVINPEPPCTYGTELTDIMDADANTISQSAPIKVPFLFKWPVSERGAQTRTHSHVHSHINIDVHIFFIPQINTPTPLLLLLREHFL